MSRKLHSRRSELEKSDSRDYLFEMIARPYPQKMHYVYKKKKKKKKTVSTLDGPPRDEGFAA